MAMLNSKSIYAMLFQDIPGPSWTSPAPRCSKRLQADQEQLAAEAMDAWCARWEVPSAAARRSFGDLSFAAEEAVDLDH